MRLFATGWMVLLVAAMPVLQSHGGSQQRIPHKTFRSADGVSQFTYPGSYALYSGGDAEDAGGSYIPVCMTFIACVVYPANKYAGTNFGAASVEELEVAGAATEAACLTAQTFGPVVEIVGKVTINGIVFLHTTGTGGALGHYLKTDHYRAFHENKCYDLSTNVTASEFANFDPGTTLRGGKCTVQEVAMRGELL
jgi:hypothetical protein